MRYKFVILHPEKNYLTAMSDFAFQYASDLHLEFDACGDHLRRLPLRPAAPLLLLAGDIHILGEPLMQRHWFWDWCADNFEQTLVVPGNHEYYAGAPRVDDTCTDGGWRWDVRPNVSYVNNRAVTLPGHDVTVLLTTLWSPVAPACETAVNNAMNDCRLISYGQGRLHGGGMTALYRRNFDWLQSALDDCRTTRKVVVTHHCPVAVEDPRYGTNSLSTAFIAPLDGFVETCGAQAWLFGHTHYNAARGMRVGQTTLLVNQLGYAPGDICDGFDPAATFTI